jgi:hypothetical protein
MAQARATAEKVTRSDSAMISIRSASPDRMRAKAWLKAAPKSCITRFPWFRPGAYSNPRYLSKFPNYRKLGILKGEKARKSAGLGGRVRDRRDRTEEEGD